MNAIIIYSERASFPGGKAFLCDDGSLSSNREEAQEHWESQFAGIVRKNWILTTNGPAKFEVIRKGAQ